MVYISSDCLKDKLVVETTKGTYTFAHQDTAKGSCGAERKCTKINAILAPFTELSEFLDVIAAVNSCSHIPKYEYSHVGLKIAKDNSTRVFSNGVKFDYKLHGSLYRENQVTMPRNCPGAYFSPRNQRKLEIGSNRGCKEIWGPYVCFEPRVVAKPEAISTDTTNVDSTFFISGGLFQFALVGLVCILFCLVCFSFVQIKKLKSKLSQQTSELA